MTTDIREPFGTEKLSLVDRFGVYLSLRAIKKYLPWHPELVLLDLGCGFDATLLSAFKNKIKHGVGVDFRVHPELRKTPPLSFIESSIESAVLKLKENAFHAITMISVLEHLQEPLAVLQQCYQLLQHEGVFLINVPTWRGKYFLEYSAFKLGTSPRAEMDDHKMYYDKRDLWPLLIKAGFKPSDIKLQYHKFGLNLFAVVTKS